MNRKPVGERPAGTKGTEGGQGASMPSDNKPLDDSSIVLSWQAGTSFQARERGVCDKECSTGWAADLGIRLFDANVKNAESGSPARVMYACCGAPVTDSRLNRSAVLFAPVRRDPDV
eukprot:9252237-Pyramimonas_sp.AAC.1